MLGEYGVWLGFLVESPASDWWRNKLRSIVLGNKLRSIVLTSRFWRRARQKLKVHVASCCDLADIIGCASQRMLSFELASKLLVAIVRSFHVRLFHERLAPSANTLVLALDHSEIPEATGWHLVRTQARFCFELLLHVLDASLRAVVLVVGAVVVEGIPAKVRTPSCRIPCKVILIRLFAVRPHGGLHLAFFVQAEQLCITAVRWVCGSRLSRTAQ